MHIGFADNGKECLFATPAGFKEARKVATFAELGNGKRKRADTGV
jgi:hypothetical protein